MLSSLTLCNFALVKKQTIEFEKGFNCLLGQSGAGKSIIIDALSFLLGAKADKSLLRGGESSMRVDGLFVNLSDDVLSILAEWDIECDGELVISRTMSSDGKTTNKVCGFPVTAKMLKELALALADFCGQHDSVRLLDVSQHQKFLDKFAGNEGLLQNVCEAYDNLKSVEKQIAALGGSEQERAREKDLLEFQIDEIEKAHLQIGEQESLKERFDFISSAEKIFEKVSQTRQKLDGQMMSLYDAKTELGSVSKFKEIDECRARIENCYYEIQDISETLEKIADNSDFDPAELEKIDSRLDLIKSLSKKYGRTVEDILAFQAESQERLDALEKSTETLLKLQNEHEKCQLVLQKACDNLSDARKKAAAELEKRVMEQLSDLEMKRTRFVVNFEKGECSRSGCDDVKFMFSANVGQEIRDLHKTASGGELSRLLLAFKNVMLSKDKVQTIVFDEIDSGISGQTADKLADKLLNISKYTQIICITHTPIVAAKANSFLLVEKKVVGNETFSTVKTLSEQETVEQIASMIGGGEAHETAYEHAKKLLKHN